MSLWARLKKALRPLPPCAECGKSASDLGHDWWDPGWPSIRLGKEPIDHWYINPEEPR